MAAQWSSDISAAGWLIERIHGFARNVGSIIPEGFDAYARVFHPLQEGPFRRWSELAAHHGRIAHREMQYHLIAGPPGAPLPASRLAEEMAVGSLPQRELTVLAGILRRHTRDGLDCWFAVWEGFGQLHGPPATAYLAEREVTDGASFDAASHQVAGLAPEWVRHGPKLELPSRSYLLLRGRLGDVIDIFGLLGRQSPNLWWPADRSWCVATEIDFGWTYVGGEHSLIEEVVAHPDLEALPAKLTDRVTIDGDRVNEALDQR